MSDDWKDRRGKLSCQADPGSGLVIRGNVFGDGSAKCENRDAEFGYHETTKGLGSHDQALSPPWSQRKIRV